MDIQGLEGPELNPLELQPEGPQAQLAEGPLPAAKMKAETAGLRGAVTTVGYSPPPAISASSQGEKSLSSAGILANRAAQAVGLALAVVVLGVGIWLGNPAPVDPATTGSTAVPIVQEAQKTFAVGRVDADAKATAQLVALLKGEKTEVDSLVGANVAALKGLEKSAPQMAQEIKKGERVIYRVYLLDFLDEDGDSVELFVDGTSLGVVNLTNAGQEILIPILRSKPAQMKMVAAEDGGGGVTVGMISSLGEAKTGILQVGQSELWQVILK